jgi:O-antigen/teichoic acid export membrane protein
MKGEPLGKNEIRLQYSGFVIFGARMLSVATGLIFAILITRNTTESEYGVWANVFDLSAYFAVLAAAIPFWTTRFVAREKEGAAKTAILANLMISVISVLLYVIAVPVFISTLNISPSYLIIYLVASLQIIQVYLIQVLEAVLRARRPQVVGYGLVIEEIVKVILAYILIINLRQDPLLSAIISLITGFSIQMIYYIRLTSFDFRQKIQWNYVKEWLKGSTANIYNLAGNQIATSILIMLFMYGGPQVGPEARGNYQVAVTIASVVGYASFLSFALYPKLLAKKSLQDITTSMKMVLMFAIPMTIGAIAIPDSFLTILDEKYRPAAPILMLLAIDALVATIGNFYTFVLFGVEKLDEEAKIPFKQLIRSNIFKVFTLPYIHSIITLPTAFYVLSNFATNQPVQAALYVTVINMVARFAMFLVLYGIVRKTIVVVVPWRSIMKYVLAAAAMAILLYVLPHPTRIVTTLGMAAAGGIMYFVLLMVMDREARELIYTILDEIRGGLSKLGMIIP